MRAWDETLEGFNAKKDKEYIEMERDNAGLLWSWPERRWEEFGERKQKRRIGCSQKMWMKWPMIYRQHKRIKQNRCKRKNQSCPKYSIRIYSYFFARSMLHSTSIVPLQCWWIYYYSFAMWNFLFYWHVILCIFLVPLYKVNIPDKLYFIFYII